MKVGRILFWMAISSLIWVQCTPKSDLPYEEQLIQFSDENKPLKDQYGALALKYWLDDDGRVLDSSFCYLIQLQEKDNPWFERLLIMNCGERKRWKWDQLSMGDSLQVQRKIEPAFVDIQLVQCFASEQDLGNHWMDMSQTHEMPEDEIIRNFRSQFLFSKRVGLKWRKFEVPTAGQKLESGAMVRTGISAELLNGRSLGSPIWMEAELGKPDQWIPAIGWVVPFALDGDSLEIIAKSEYCFGKQGSEMLQIPPDVPIIFHVGIHRSDPSVVTLRHD